jgi:predicted HNH restriction endonuclease
MEFHHPDSFTKDFTISTRTSWKVVERELRKCVLLCANCHREVHEGLHPGMLVQPEDDRGCYWDDPEPEQLVLLE